MEFAELEATLKLMITEVVLSQGNLRAALLEADVALANAAIMRQRIESENTAS